MTLGCWADVTSTAHAVGLWAQAGPELRGPGYYYSLVKIAVLLAVYFGWIRTCAWVNQDAEKVGLNAGLWNGVLLAAGFLGLLLVWVMSAFFPGLLLLLLFYGGAAGTYVAIRNAKVPAAHRVLTESHLRAWFSGLASGNFKKPKRKTVALPADGAAPKRKTKAELPEAPTGVHFLGRSSDRRGEDPQRVSRAENSKGYRTAQQLVLDAIDRRATDIHLEPSREDMAVRFRVDGIMQGADPLPRAVGDALINIFKVLSDMNITEKRKPQDGSFSAQVNGRHVDFRVATAGSVVGEKLVLRVLDRDKQLTRLSDLGMREKMHEQVRALVTQPHGLFLTCGPTGAGKSTTLYAALNEIDRYQHNIITIEDPVEYHLDNVTQIEVDARAGKGFAEELRGILRQDPDIIMIGEVRDKETAEIACQAAQTGHMVFSTLHANDTVTAISRLIDLGLATSLIASALSGVLSQRLVRLLCPQCRVRYKPNPDLLRKLNLPADKIKYFFRPPEAGDRAEDGSERPPCGHCGASGYRGRTGIFELLVINEGLRSLVRDNSNLAALKAEAVRAGLRSLQEDGIRQVIEGKTSIAELLRVCK